MKTLNVIFPQLSVSDWAVSIDLKDAYLHIPVHPQSRRFLGFHFMDMIYQCKVLPFGLLISHWVFARVVSTLVGLLRRLGLRVFCYKKKRDDWLLVTEFKELLELLFRTTLLCTQDLGFLVFWKKSSPVPQRLSSFLGTQLNIPDSGFLRRLLGSRPLLAKISRPSRQLCGLIPHCRMLMRLLQLHCLRFFIPLIDSQDKLVPLSPEIKDLCRAWASPSCLLEGKPFAPPPLSLVVTTDASYLGWGRFLIHIGCQGCGRRRRLWTS